MIVVALAFGLLVGFVVWYVGTLWRIGAETMERRDSRN